MSYVDLGVIFSRRIINWRYLWHYLWYSGAALWIAYCGCNLIFFSNTPFSFEIMGENFCIDSMFEQTVTVGATTHVLEFLLTYSNTTCLITSTPFKINFSWINIWLKNVFLICNRTRYRTHAKISRSWLVAALYEIMLKDNVLYDRAPFIGAGTVIQVRVRKSTNAFLDWFKQTYYFFQLILLVHERRLKERKMLSNQIA